MCRSKILKILLYWIVFDYIWLVLIDQERSRTIKKSEKKDETIKDDQGRSKNKVVNFRGSMWVYRYAYLSFIHFI